MKPFFTEEDCLFGRDDVVRLERANAKTAPLLRQIESDKLAYDMIAEQHNAGLERIARLESALKEIIEAEVYPNQYDLTYCAQRARVVLGEK